MFYSQFILAKKGPLGTIWIAAHLERKLRKNQVADTDIGISVDSIIFPDVPIALRLSSHLLLGVVRIYSRKVNYLFDDCSEALLKVKQAFRSTAVDLPPDESTAPYHAITLPETFDLDDFELPDQGIFEGNYVDHHISNKEQITLQDTMDGVVFSTSQFGLDERFGDGDTSQIGLDLDEDRLLNKQPSPENVRDGIDLDHVHHTSSHLSEFIINETNEEVTESAKSMEAEPRGSDAAAISQYISIDSEYTESFEYVQAPTTPGLVEEPNLSNQKASTSDDMFESEKHLLETGTWENPSNTLHSSPRGDDIMVNHDSVLKIKQSTANLENPDITPDFTEKSSSLLSNGYQLEEPSSPTNQLASSELVSESVQVLKGCSSDIRVNDNFSNSNMDTSLDLPSESPLTLDKSGGMQGDVTKFHELQPSILSESFKVADNTPESVNEMNQSADACQLIQPTDTGLSNKTESSITTNPANFDSSPMSELPAREKLLSVPEQHTELSPDLLLDTTPAKVLSATEEDGTGVTTGQKRSFTESSLTVDSMHTAESSGKIRLGKTAESIPDDEDLLSSILVGKRSSFLKLKPTPNQNEVVPMKRPRITSRNITYKRKVLMDEAMVLHGDTIREQLVSTEDIRRLRKKAPCTHKEIWMIQKQYLEEDIVYDPISTGMSMELVCLHNQAYELSGITVTKVNDPMLPKESTCEMQPPVDNVVIPNTHSDVIEDLNFESQPRTISLQTEKQTAEGYTSLLGHGDIESNKGGSTASLSLPTSLEQGVISEMEADKEGVSVVEAAEHPSSVPVDSLPSTCGIPADNAETTTFFAVPLAGETNYCSKVDNEASLLDHSNKDEAVYFNADAANDGIDSLFHADSETRNKLSSKETDDGELIKDIESPHTVPETHGYETLDNNGNIEGCPHPVDHDVNMEMLYPIDGQNEIPHEFHESPRQANRTTGEGSAVVTDDYNGLHYMTTDHDTGFLNVDDDDLEVDESYAPSVEETRKRIVDDSGWSSRTRAVGKYLQIMFDKEAEHGKNVILVGNLLAGKSRKEASRMFFETLVLKTRDYIDVEQASPFNNINLRPRSMLLKSDF